MDDFKNQIYSQIAQIPDGKVSTYGDIARFAGFPGYARHVGKLLGQLPEGSTLPWFRVINSQGKISQQGDDFLRQRQCLIADGIEVSVTGRISLKRYRWDGYPVA
ncbi:MGMT family protein [Photobacterium sp. SP02]|uniref:MGMT family protein n=1 Tax=Photobacterium sp. SP02 TaxID=3032280 RepID=UPI0031456E4D